jgi:hypothetical protein
MALQSIRKHKTKKELIKNELFAKKIVGRQGLEP